MSVRRILFTSAFAAGLATMSSGQVTSLVSVNSSGVEGDGHSAWPLLSFDGRFVAFSSHARNLVANKTTPFSDIFVHDRASGLTERVSIASDGSEANSDSYGGGISADGRFVAFYSAASNLVANDTNTRSDVFVHDRVTGTTERVNVSSTGAQAKGNCSCLSISDDGRFVEFETLAGNLVPGDTNGLLDVFVHDRQTGSTEIVSVDSSGNISDGSSDDGRLSGDGRYVTFASTADNLVAGDGNGTGDVFVHDRQTGMTERVSVDSSGLEGNGFSTSPSISSDGRYVVFNSVSSNLVPNDTNAAIDVFLRDRQTGTTELISVDSTGAQGNKDSYEGRVSGDGQVVMFLSLATNLAPSITNAYGDMFIRDRVSGTTVLASKSSAGVEGDAYSFAPAISEDGRVVAFQSDSDNLVPNDTNAESDVFVVSPDLTLDVAPQLAAAADTIAFDVFSGALGGPLAVVAVDVNGVSIFTPVVFGTFDGQDNWTQSYVVPPGLTGNVVGFLAFGTIPSGKVRVTQRVAVSFQ